VASSNPEKIGRYQILERVGKGGMGVLYRGVDPVLDREVAIKVMLVDFSDDTEQMRPRFYREAQAAAKLQHSNIVTIFEFAEDHNTPYIVMEFLAGTPLDARMASPIPLTLDDKVNIVAQLCSALHYAHGQGVVHRDIKPANLFILPDGTVKLLDFGVAKLMTSTLTRQGDVLGSVSYMSPEQVSGSESIDGRSDIFSVGVMLYEMLAGRKPFKGETPTATIVQILREDPPALEKLVPGIPPRLVAALKRALAKEPADRFPTAGEFGKELQIIRRSIQAAASDGQGLDETRFASSSEMAALHQQLEQDAAAKSASTVSAAPHRKWAVPVIAAAVLLIGVAGLTLKMSGTPADGATPTSATATTGAAAAGSGAPVPASPVIRIESTPAGAELLLNGQSIGEVTPAPVTFAGPGPHTLRLSKRGFVSQDVNLTAADLTAPSLRYSLVAAEVPKVAVNITSAYPVEVISGRETLAGPGVSHSLSVPSGTRLRVVSREHLLDAGVVASGRTNYTSPSLGKLTVLTKFETCKVKIGDRMLGFPPITRMPIVAGQYRVDIVCDSGNNPPSVFVTVAANETATARIQ